MPASQNQKSGDLKRRKLFPVSPPLERSMYEMETAPPSLSEAEWGLFEFTGGILMAFATVLFSLWFPFVLTPQAASKTYLPAFYHYDPSTSHFDNSAWTYGTDYFLAVVMSVLAYSLILSLIHI